MDPSGAGSSLVANHAFVECQAQNNIGVDIGRDDSCPSEDLRNPLQPGLEFAGKRNLPTRLVSRDELCTFLIEDPALEIEGDDFIEVFARPLSGIVRTSDEISQCLGLPGIPEKGRLHHGHLIVRHDPS